MPPDHPFPLPPRRREHPRPPTLRLSRAPSVPFACAAAAVSRAIEQETSKGSFWGVVARRGRRRTAREDRFATRVPGGTDPLGRALSLLAVFDGHGGERAADFAATTLPDLLLRLLADGAQPRDAAVRAFHAVDTQLAALLRAAASPPSRYSPTSLAKRSSGSSFAAVALAPGLDVSRAQSTDRGAVVNDAAAFVYGCRSPSHSPGEPGVPPTATGVSVRRGASRADDQLAAIPVRPRFCGCGTTATVVALHGASASVMHVGDSRAVLGLSCGNARRLCEDHRPGRADELRRIEREGGLVLEVRGALRVNGVLAVSRAIGDVELKQWVVGTPDVATLALDETMETLVVASDGLWDVVSDQEAVEMARKCGLGAEGAEKMAAQQLVDWAWERGSVDDVCVAVINLRKYLAEIAAKSVDLGGDTDDEDADDECDGDDDDGVAAIGLHVGRIGLGLHECEQEDEAEAAPTDAVEVAMMRPMSAEEMAPKTQKRPSSKPW